MEKKLVVKNFSFTPVLGWSASRYDTFSLCKRQYYYTYYSKFDPDFPRDRIEKLKAMTSIPLETGSIVHETIAALLERQRTGDNTVNKDHVFAFAERKLREALEQKDFFETHYDGIASMYLTDIWPNVLKALNNFFESDRFSLIAGKPLEEKNAWIIEPSDYGETRIDGLKAYCKVDFLFPEGDEIHIIDWKTGKENKVKNHKQLTGYVTWACSHFQKNPALVKPVIAYLYPKYTETALSLNEFDVAEFSVQVRHETREMKGYCLNMEENIPENKERFEKCTDENICSYCNFKELCS